MFNKSLTIVLPVHNGESGLRKSVGELLELASELTPDFGVLIVDDGSTDSTFEVAEELASRYPQVSVRRHRQCLGLGATTKFIRRHVKSDVVMLHDGVSTISSQHVRKRWQQWVEKSSDSDLGTDAADGIAEGLADFAQLPQMHAAMQRVHRQLLGFQLITMPPKEIVSHDDAFKAAPRTDASHARERTGVGQIPSLPRPNFLSALTSFAMGE